MLTSSVLSALKPELPGPCGEKQGHVGNTVICAVSHHHSQGKGVLPGRDKDQLCLLWFWADPWVPVSSHCPCVLSLGQDGRLQEYGQSAASSLSLESPVEEKAPESRPMRTHWTVKPVWWRHCCFCFSICTVGTWELLGTEACACEIPLLSLLLSLWGAFASPTRPLDCVLCGSGLLQSLFFLVCPP